MDFWIWRDAVDKNSFTIGIKQGIGDFTAWATLYIDAISDMFGKEFCESVKAIEPGVPVHIVGEIRRK